MADLHYRWFSWGVTSLPMGKSWGLHLAHLCKIQASEHYVESLPLVLKEAASLKVRGSLYSCLLIMHALALLKGMHFFHNTSSTEVTVVTCFLNIRAYIT